MRDNNWLSQRLEQIWGLLFPDVSKENTVNIIFKGRWKRKFGHITSNGKDTEIAINGLFNNLEVPEYIVDITIAHELIHYMHGFHSPLPKQFKYPHKHGVVDNELLRRGFGHWIRIEKNFVKREWPNLYQKLK